MAERRHITSTSTTEEISEERPPVESTYPTPPPPTTPPSPPPPLTGTVEQKLAEAVRQLEVMTKRAQEAELAKVQAETKAMEVRAATYEALTKAQESVAPPSGTDFFTDVAAMDHMVEALNKTGATFRDNHRVDAIREDGVRTFRWEPMTRPYTAADILSVRETDEGHVVVTGDGQKKVVQL